MRKFIYLGSGTKGMAEAYNGVVLSLSFQEHNLSPAGLQILRMDEVYIDSVSVQKMNTEDYHQRWQSQYYQEKRPDSDSTLSTLIGKRFQRSNSRHKNPSPPANSKNAAKEQPSIKHNTSCNQLKPASPQVVSGIEKRSSIYAPQYIKISQTPDFLCSNKNERQRMEGDYLQKTMREPEVANSITCLKRVSDIMPKTTRNKEAQRPSLNTSARNQAGNWFGKKKQPYEQLSNSEIVREGHHKAQYLNSIEQKMKDLEEANGRLINDINVTKKERDSFKNEFQKMREASRLWQQENTSHPGQQGNTSRPSQQQQLKKNLPQAKLSSHNRSMGNIYQQSQSLREISLSNQVESIRRELESVKSGKGYHEMDCIVTDLRNENAFYKKQLQGVLLRCRMLEQRNSELAQKCQDTRKLQAEIKFLRADLQECDVEISRLQCENKKLRNEKLCLNPRESIGMFSQADSLNLSASWAEK